MSSPKRLTTWLARLDILYSSSSTDTISFIVYPLTNLHAASQIMVYTAGFPCQPYSLLSTTRMMLADQNSKQMWAVVRNVRDTQPMETRTRDI